MEFQFGRNIKSGVFWIGSLKTLGQIFVWINTIIIARFLDPADYGLAGMAILITSFILLIGNFGFGASIIQRKELRDIHLYSLFWITFLTGLVFAVVIYATAPVAAKFFKNQAVVPLLRLSTIGLFFTVISDIPNNLLLKTLQYRSAGLVDFFSNLLASICVLIFAVSGYGATSLILGLIITGFLRFTLACTWNRWLPKLQFTLHGLRGFITFGGAIVIDRLLWYAYSNSDYMILARKLGAETFGYYSFAFNLATMPISKIQPIISPVLYSSFSVIQDDLEQLREQYLKIINFSFTLYIMIFCGIFWVSREFVLLFLGDKWEPIIVVLQILLIIQPLRGVASIGPALINALGRPDVSARNMLIFVGIMVPSFLVGSRWGMVGVSSMWCIAYPFAFFITLSISLRISGIRMRRYLAQLVPGLRLAVVASAALYAFCLLVPHLPFITASSLVWVRFGGKVAVGTLVYLLLLWLFDRRFITTALQLFKR
jgi:O-antigen/teichoic acid export membrane protein